MPESPFSSCTDTQLLSSSLHIEDPRSAYSLIAIIPANSKIERIQASYDLPKDKLRCSVPGCPASHKKGFVALLDTGEHTAIGHICGKKIFQTDWKRVRDDHYQLLKRKRLLGRRATFLQTSTTVIVTLRVWRQIGENIDKARLGFRRVAPELAEVLRERSLRSDVILSKKVKRDQKELEIARDAQAMAGGRGRRQSEERDEVLHILQGAEFFNCTRLHGLMQEAIDLVEAAETKLSEPTLSNDQISRSLRKVSQANDKVRHFVRLHEAAREALTNENFIGIINWWSQTEGASNGLRFQGGLVKATFTNNEVPNFQLPSFNPLDDTVSDRLSI